ncbi:MAG: hypothetical protein ACRENP_08030 [Longimicrobiales bacterium]
MTFKLRFNLSVKRRVKYVDASAVLRILFESGPCVPLDPEDRVVSSQIVQVETFRAVDRARLLGHLDDAETAMAGSQRSPRRDGDRAPRFCYS